MSLLALPAHASAETIGLLDTTDWTENTVLGLPDGVRSPWYTLAEVETMGPWRQFLWLLDERWERVPVVVARITTDVRGQWHAGGHHILHVVSHDGHQCYEVVRNPDLHPNTDATREAVWRLVRVLARRKLGYHTGYLGQSAKVRLSEVV